MQYLIEQTFLFCCCCLYIDIPTVVLFPELMMMMMIGLAGHALIYILLIFKFDLYRGACGGGRRATAVCSDFSSSYKFDLECLDVESEMNVLSSLKDCNKRPCYCYCFSIVFEFTGTVARIPKHLYRNI
jgi:hypothetical protein